VNQAGEKLETPTRGLNGGVGAQTGLDQEAKEYAHQLRTQTQSLRLHGGGAASSCAGVSPEASAFRQYNWAGG
jgi:hypothetical protein